MDLHGRFAAQNQFRPERAVLAARKPWIVPIPCTTKLDRLVENIGAIETELSREDLREIKKAAAKITIEGARYPESAERMTGL